VSEHGELDVLLIGRRAEPQEVKEPADEQERERAAHAGDLGRFAEPLLRAQILRLHPTGIHEALRRPCCHGLGGQQGTARRQRNPVERRSFNLATAFANHKRSILRFMQVPLTNNQASET
jgi:hypothetical protein